MKLEKLGLLMTFVLVAIAMVYGAAAATTSVTPTANGQVTGSSYLLAITETDTDNVTNVTWDYQLGSGSWVHIGSVTNDTAQDGQFNLTWDTTTITDQGTVTLNISAFTGLDYVTSILDSTTVSGLDIDNTNPTTTYGTDTPSDKFTWENSSITITTATDASLVNCTLTSSPSFTSNSTTTYLAEASGSRCAYQIDNIIENTYSYYWTTRDNLNSSTASTRYVSIEDIRGGQYVPLEEVVTDEKAKKTDTKTIVIFGIVVVLIGLIWNNSKK